VLHGQLATKKTHPSAPCAGGDESPRDMKPGKTKIQEGAGYYTNLTKRCAGPQAPNAARQVGPACEIKMEEVGRLINQRCKAAYLINW